MYRTVFWTLWERPRARWCRRMALKYVNYHMWNESPVQVWCMIQGTRGWCTRMTLKDGLGREGGSGWETCTLMADPYQCMAKPIQYCKGKKKNCYGPNPHETKCKISSLTSSLLNSSALIVSHNQSVMKNLQNTT